MKTELVKALDFELVTQPAAYFHNGEVRLSSKHQLISRSNDGTPLSVMGSNYHPMLVSHFEESTQRLSEISGYPIVGYQQFQEGRVILSFLENTRKQEAAGFPIGDYIVVGSSVDGTRPFFVGTSTILIRCTNAFSQINTIERVKHTKSAPVRLEKLYSYFNEYVNGREKLYTDFEEMTEFKITDAVRDEFAKFMIEAPEGQEIGTRKSKRLLELIDCIRVESADVGKNVFGLFQGVTKFTTHNLQSTQGTFGSVLGQRAWMNQRAYNRCLEYIR
ncbi:MAG: DUF932 domain-containing protein [Spirochaetia bacterium]|nr:DUF932 domain-containing protein [Spirochaetia bacterium]